MARETVTDLIALLAVARERNFTRAAAQLGVSQPALSRTIRALEARLGVRLLTRSTRSVALTEAGERLVQAVGPHFDGIDAGLAALTAMREKPAGSLRISSVEHASETILAPAVAQLLADYPDIRVEIINDYALTDIVAERYDAGVRLGEQVAKDDRPTDRAGLSSSSRRCAILLRPAAQARHATRLNRSRLYQPATAYVGGLWPWPFTKDGRELKVRAEGPLAFNTISLILDTALAGLGLAYLPEDFVRDHVAAGRLVRVLADWSPVMTGYHLYYPNRQPSPAFALLVEALRYPMAISQKPPFSGEKRFVRILEFRDK